MVHMFVVASFPFWLEENSFFCWGPRHFPHVKDRRERRKILVCSRRAGMRDRQKLRRQEGHDNRKKKRTTTRKK